MRWWSFLHNNWCCSITRKLAMINFIKVDLVCRQRWQKVGQPLHLVCLWKLTMLTEMQTSRFAQSADYQSKQAVIWYFLGTSLDWGRLRCKPGIMWLIVGGGWFTRRWFALGFLFVGILARVGWGVTIDQLYCQYVLSLENGGKSSGQVVVCCFTIPWCCVHDGKRQQIAVLTFDTL